MAQKSSEYWEKRIAASTWKTYNSLEERNRDLLDFYIDASEQVKKELYSIAEKYSKNGVLSLSEMHKQNRLTALNKKLESIIEDLGHKTEESAKKNMQDGFRTVYKDTAVAMGDEDFSMPNKKLMEKLLQEPWRGDSFSGRLWKNQKKLAIGLNDHLLTGLQQGKTATEIAVSLHNFMGQGFNECHRLVRTETMHYLNDATMQRYKDAGIKYVQIWAAEDERTCDECSKYHGKIYPIDKCPHVPFHPNCRCTIIPVTDESMIEDYEKRHGGKKSIAKDSGSGIIKANKDSVYEGIPKSWKRIEGADDSLRSVNPNYTSKNAAYKSNCTNCISAYEMRKRGYNVTARPATKNHYLSRHPEEAWTDPDIKTASGTGLDDIISTARNWPENARAEIAVTWKGSSKGHVFVAEKENGKIRFYDVQSGERMSSKIFTHVEEGKTLFWRIDNLEPSDRGITACEAGD